MTQQSPDPLLNPNRAPTLAGVERAAAKVAELLPLTPLLPLDIGGTTIWCKAECLQPVGAFKICGAWHRLTDLTPEQAAAGVVGVSSGNHAQGVAWAARRLGIAGDDRDAEQCAADEARRDARAGGRRGSLRQGHRIARCRGGEAARRTRRDACPCLRRSVDYRGAGQRGDRGARAACRARDCWTGQGDCLLRRRRAVRRPCIGLSRCRKSSRWNPKAGTM